MKKGSLSSTQGEIRALIVQKGLPLSVSDKEFLINRIVSETQELHKASNNNESAERVAEEAIDIIIQSIQLILALGIDPNKAYRMKMDKNWSRQWKKNNKGEYRSS